MIKVLMVIDQLFQKTMVYNKFKLSIECYKKYPLIFTSNKVNLIINFIQIDIVMNKIFKNFGKYPLSYNPRIHGTYNGAINYAKNWKNLWNTKIGDIPVWFSKQDVSFHGAISSVSRGMK
ncbi:hypothetical protein A3Q56_03466 [Intoshia linei]|uniref:Uncharacterized protein n=1 Tax=Intoshia linei TaxID=1819745 RepID=A0A177B4Y7_9BILA|nr:hypothetical protein A3Q56_03466 [Intoshia linei]